MKYGKAWTCKCGVRFRIRIYPSGAKHYECRRCMADRVNTWLAVEDHPAVCDHCGADFLTRRKYKYPTQDGGKYCSDECRYVGGYARQWPISPLGPEYCRAPVPGGCGRKRKLGSSRAPFCAAHDKRQHRGTRIDTPVSERHSKLVKAGLPTPSREGDGDE